MQPLIPIWTAWQTDIAEIETRNVETLAKLYQEFEAGKSRLMIAFRHPNTNDPYVLSHLIWQALPQTARALNLRIGTPHAHFIYDRGIPLWAGSYLSWVFSRLGGVPIQRGKLDVLALKKARSLLLDGRFPLAVAPEGGNNGHNELVSPLEPGIAQLAFWCAEDLRLAGREESVVILPVGIQYRYLKAPWPGLETLITQLEADSGLDPLGQGDVTASQVPLALYGRLYRLADHLLRLMEGYYSDFYGVSFVKGDEAPYETKGPNAQLTERLSVLMDEALKVAENYFNVRPKGSLIDRCRKLEQAGWTQIFREGCAKFSPVELGLANQIAKEADLRMWHMRLVESFVAVTGHYVKDYPSADRFAETTLLLLDMVEKIKGHQPAARPYLGAQKAIVTVGEPIQVSRRLADYQTKRRGAIAALTQDLQAAMESLILTQ